MQDIYSIGNLETRRRALRLSIGEFVKAVGMHPSTWERARKGESDMTARRVRRAHEFLVAEEQRLLQHLISLHPDFAAEQLSRRGGREKAGGEGVSTTAASPAATSPAAQTEEAA